MSDDLPEWPDLAVLAADRVDDEDRDCGAGRDCDRPVAYRAAIRPDPMYDVSLVYVCEHHNKMNNLYVLHHAPGGRDVDAAEDATGLNLVGHTAEQRAQLP